MNDQDKELEAELHALRPREPSPQLPERIARSLAAAPISAWRPGRLALLAGLVAAAVLAAILWPRGPGARIPKQPPAGPAIEVADPLPTFRTYQQALAQSPDALEALIDKYAALSLAQNQSSKPVHAFPLGNMDLVD
jgi:hypothetical protein